MPKRKRSGRTGHAIAVKLALVVRRRLGTHLLIVGPFLIGAAALPAILVPFFPALAGPTGGSVVAGSASITQTGGTTNINQSTYQAIINWQTFSIARGETVNFYQPSVLSTTLNRVIGNETSIIAGALNANGQVFIVNSAGVIFTKGAEVNVGGLVASTLNISNSNFMARNYTFSGSSTAAVINKGHIRATDSGYIALLGKTVVNNGVISAKLGTVAMASGTKISLNLNGDSLINVTIDQGTMNALVSNKQLIKADGGQVIMTAKAADSLLSAQVNNTGVIQARTMSALRGGRSGTGTVHVGKIQLIASGGTVHVAGKLDASAPKGGKGGTIETSGNKVVVADNAIITTKSSSGSSSNGTWLIDPTDFTITGGSGSLTASGIGAVTLENSLTNGNVTIATASGGSENGDINVNAAVTWGSNSVLTLDAANNININAAITATGASAGLVMNYGGYATTGSAVAGSGYNINNLTLNSGDGSLAVGSAAITLSGANASLSINGQAYTLVHSMSDLAAISNNPTGYYAVAQNLDASGTTYNGSVINAAFTGTLAGLGHSVSNLTINNTAETQNGGAGSTDGLIAQLGTSSNAYATVRDIGLINANISATGYNNRNMGALVAINYGNISNTYAMNVMVNTGDTVPPPDNGASNIGGLVGDNQSTGTITNSYVYNANSLYTIDSAGKLTNTTFVNGNSAVGGLVGSNEGTITGSSSKALVIGEDSGGSVGGLVGSNSGGRIVNGVNTDNRGIFNSSAYGTVTAAEDPGTGGLVGTNSGFITSSKASGDVSFSWGDWDFITGGVGGFVGVNSGLITASTATGNVTVGLVNSTPPHDQDALLFCCIGGFAGINNGTITTSSYVGGNVSAGVFSTVGGFVGYNNGTIDQSSATLTQVIGVNSVGGFAGINGTSGKISNSNAVIRDRVTSVNQIGYTSTGGFVGTNNGSITNSTASGSGSVIGIDNTGGFVGTNAAGGTISNSTTSINVQGTGNYTGGFVGYNSGTIYTSSASGTVNGAGYTGGFAGANDSGGVLVYNNESGNVNGGDTTGGFVGQNAGQVGNVGASGNVTGGSEVGGLFGSNLRGGNVDDSTATGSVSGTGGDVGNIGGVNTGSVNNSAYTGSSTHADISVQNGTVNGVDAGSANNSGAGDTNPGNGDGNASGSNTSNGDQTQTTSSNDNTAAQNGAPAADAVVTRDVEKQAKTDVKAADSATAGTPATSANAPANINDNLKVEEAPSGPPPAPIGNPVKRRHKTALTPPQLKRPNFGAAIRSIEIDGQHYDLEKNIKDDTSKDDGSKGDSSKGDTPQNDTSKDIQPKDDGPKEDKAKEEQKAQ